MRLSLHLMQSLRSLHGVTVEEGHGRGLSSRVVKPLHPFKSSGARRPIDPTPWWTGRGPFPRAWDPDPVARLACPQASIHRFRSVPAAHSISRNVSFEGLPSDQRSGVL